MSAGRTRPESVYRAGHRGTGDPRSTDPGHRPSFQVDLDQDRETSPRAEATVGHPRQCQPASHMFPMALSYTRRVGGEPMAEPTRGLQRHVRDELTFDRGSSLTPRSMFRFRNRLWLTDLCTRNHQTEPGLNDWGPKHASKEPVLTQREGRRQPPSLGYSAGTRGR